MDHLPRLHASAARAAARDFLGAAGLAARQLLRHHPEGPSSAAGIIDRSDRPAPPRDHQPRVIVAGASEPGPRFAVTRPLTVDVELDIEASENGAPRIVRRPRRR